MADQPTTPLLINEEPRGRSRLRGEESPEDRVELQGPPSEPSISTSTSSASPAKRTTASKNITKPPPYAFVGNATASDWAKVFKKKKPIKIKKRIKETVDDDDGSIGLKFTRFRAKSKAPRARSPTRGDSALGSSSSSNNLSDLPLRHEEEPHVVVAKSALLIPFRYSNPMDADVQNILSKWAARYVTLHDGAKLNLWRVKQSLPHELSDLDPRFKEVLGMAQTFDDMVESGDDGEVSFNTNPNYFSAASAAAAIGLRHPSLGRGGEGPSSQADPLSTNCKRLELNPEILSVFSNAKIVANQGDQSITCKVRIEGIDLVAFPLGTAILVLHVNWAPEQKQKMTLDELKSWLHIARYQYKVPGLFEGWLFQPDSEDKAAATASNASANPNSLPPHGLNPPTASTHNVPLGSSVSQKYIFGAPDASKVASFKVLSNVSKFHSKELGERVAAAVYGESPISLNALGNWLVMEDDKDDDSDMSNILSRYTKRCYHQSCIVTDKKPNQDRIAEFLFNARKPPSDPRYFMPQTWEGSDTMLAPRSNRNIAVGLQGTMSLSWPAFSDTPLDTDFEVRKWPGRFMGIYLVLTTHAYGEKSALLELSHLAGDSGNLLTRIADQSLGYMTATRSALVALATLMTRFNLKMSTDDCGGLPEYMEYFSAIRTCFGIKHHRKELRKEIQDVLSLIETNYAEERRKIQEQEKLDREKQEETLAKKEKEKDRLKVRYERFVTVVSSFALPIFIVTSLFSTSLNDMPQYPWWWVMGITVGLSVILLVLLIVLWRSPTSGSGRARGFVAKRHAFMIV